MTTNIAIVGIGGQGRECLDIAEAMASHGHDLKVVGFFDDAPSQENLALVLSRGYRVLGTSEDLMSNRGVLVCLGIGDGERRGELDARLIKFGLDSHVLVHPHSTIGSQVELGPGAVVFAGARLTTNVRLGRHVHVNQNVTIAHDSVVEDYSTINPQAAISGAVQIGSRAMVGAGSVILQGRTVGHQAQVGAAACVARDVPPHAAVKGVPAR